MKKLAAASLLLSQVLIAPAPAQEADPLPRLAVTAGGITDGKPIPDKYAYCMPDGNGRTRDGGNTSPAVSWSGAPAGTQSYALIVVDRDVPASFDAANKADQTIAADFPRQNFYHWVLVDIPPTVTSLAEGADSKGITPGGKPPGKAEYGIDGHNDYAYKAKMGQNAGYDGPCPPWNDERLHRYHFMVHALDVPSLGLSGSFGGEQAEAAMAHHVLARGEVVGTYTNNRNLLMQ